MDHILDQLLNWHDLRNNRKKLVLINLLKFHDRESIVSYLPESLIHDIHKFINEDKLFSKFPKLYTLFDYEFERLKTWSYLSSSTRILFLKRLVRREDWKDILSKISIPLQREILDSCYLIENSSYIIPLLKMFSNALEFKHLAYIASVASIKDLKEFLKIPTVKEGLNDQFFQYDVLSKFSVLNLKFLLKQVPEIHTNLAGHLATNQYLDLILENYDRFNLESLRLIVISLSHNQTFIKNLLSKISSEKLKYLLNNEESFIGILGSLRNDLRYDFESLILSLIKSSKSDSKIRDL